MTQPEQLDPSPGAAVYSRRTLAAYDLFVLGLSNQLLWRCPTSELLAWYDRHVGNRHLDVGVGTGYFLDHCRFPSSTPTIALVDLNEESLRFTAHRIRRYRPLTRRANVLEPLPADLGPFDSIGVNYLIHCLPGDMRSKASVFANLRPLLAPGGVLFGATILGQGVPRNPAARAVMRLYNRRGIFGNRTDDLSSLVDALATSFDRPEVTVRGCVALFAARV